MIWLTWRQHRQAAIGATVLLLVVAAVLLVDGVHLHRAFRSSGLASCLRERASSCGSAEQSFRDHFSGLADGVVPWLNFVPGVLGVLLGAPLLAREIEHGTFRLAWTQSIGRGRWLIVKLAVIGVSIVALGVAFSLLVTWWRGPFDQLDGRLATEAFDFEGLVVPVYALFAFTLGAAVGAILRRVVPAMAVTLALFLAVRLSVAGLLRQHYQRALSRAVDLSQAGGSTNRTDWVLSNGLADRSGHHLTAGQESRALSIAQEVAGQKKIAGAGHGSGAFDPGMYLHQRGYSRWIVYQPASRFWTFQMIEASIYVAMIAGLVALTRWWVRRRLT